MARRSRGTAARGLVPLLLCLVLMSCGVLLTGCANGEPVQDRTSSAAATSVRVDDVLADRPARWKTGTVEGGASLQFTASGYRMTAGTWPLVSPSVDRRTVDLDPVVIHATFLPVSGTGLYGVACAVTSSGAYTFMVGTQSNGEPYYGIARLTDGTTLVLRDSDSPGSLAASDVLPNAPATQVAATCRSGDRSGTALLRLTVQGRLVMDIVASNGDVDGQVGLVAVSRVVGTDLVVDVSDVSIRSPG